MIVISYKGKKKINQLINITPSTHAQRENFINGTFINIPDTN